MIAVVLAGLSALVLVVAAAAAWTSRTALDTTRFVAQVGPVIDQEPVRAAVASEVSRQLVALVGTPLAKPLVSIPSSVCATNKALAQSNLDYNPVRSRDFAKDLFPYPNLRGCQRRTPRET